MNNFMKAVCVIVLFLSFPVLNWGQSPEQLMERANKYYQDQKYDQAIQAYKPILSQGYESPALYYNLGNAYFKSGSIGNAILYYERGLKLSPGDEDIQFNLKVANSRTVDKITELPKIFIVQWWEVFITSFSLSGWSVITVIIFWIFLTSIGLFILSGRIRIQKISLMAGSISLALLILVVVILISRYNHEAVTDYGVLTEEIYSVKVAPDQKSNDQFVIHEGIKFVVEDQVNGWYKIRLVDGKVGWIPQNVFGLI